MSKQLANVTKNPQRISQHIHPRSKQQPESYVIIVKPSILQSKSNAQPGASPVAVVECETILQMYVAKLRKQIFMPWANWTVRILMMTVTMLSMSPVWHWYQPGQWNQHKPICHWNICRTYSQWRTCKVSTRLWGNNQHITRKRCPKLWPEVNYQTSSYVEWFRSHTSWNNTGYCQKPTELQKVLHRICRCLRESSTNHWFACCTAHKVY